MCGWLGGAHWKFSSPTVAGVLLDRVYMPSMICVAQALGATVDHREEATVINRIRCECLLLVLSRNTTVFFIFCFLFFCFLCFCHVFHTVRILPYRLTVFVGACTFGGKPTVVSVCVTTIWSVVMLN